MPDPSPIPSGSIFGRKASIFTGRKPIRREGTTPISPPVSEEPETSPGNRRDSSVVSLPNSVGDDGLGRSNSLRSHGSQSSIHQHKSRGSSVAIPSRSDIGLHRQSRSISANATATGRSFSSILSPQKSIENFHHDRDYSIAEAAHRPSFSMLAGPFSHGLKRSDSDRPPIPSYVTGTNASVPTLGSMQQQPVANFLPGAVLNHIHDTCRKRIATLEYLRKVHEGHIYYINTLLYTPTNLSQLPSMQYVKLGRRAVNYVLLGTSIPPLLDMNSGSPLEYLRSLAALLSEYDTYQQLNNPDAALGARGRMGAMFKSGMRGVKSRRASTAAESLMDQPEHTQFDALPLPPMSTGNLPDFTYLQTPSLPFDPDFHSAFATLADILIDTYSVVIQLLPNTEALGPGVGEAFAKADKILRKVLVQNAVQELGETTRKDIKTEINGLGRIVLGGLI